MGKSQTATRTSPPDGRTLSEQIEERLKRRSPEQDLVVGPLVEYLCATLGWDINQIAFGRKEWRVPKSPSEATKREKREHFDGFPVDIAVFDSVQRFGDPKHLLFMIECKQPTEEAGVSQCETYLSREPHAKLGIWANSPELSAPAVFSFRLKTGNLLNKRKLVGDVPRPGEPISPRAQRLVYADLRAPSTTTLR